jgi:hypothetical protein
MGRTKEALLARSLPRHLPQTLQVRAASAQGNRRLTGLASFNWRWCGDQVIRLLPFRLD